MHVGKKIQIVVIIMQLLVNIVLKNMGKVGVMEIANGATINAQMELLQVIDYKISICKL